MVSLHDTSDLQPEELLLAQLIRLAIKDAKQCRNERLRLEAARWLWWVAPVVAERAGVVSEVPGTDNENSY